MDNSDKVRNHQNAKSKSLNNSKVITEIARRNIEKSININETHETEAYYSNRYGWTLRKIIY